MKGTALLTFSIGPVHTFIGQARRIADLWAGSAILSDLMTVAVTHLLGREGCTLLFPAVRRESVPHTLPNRFVARVPRISADAIARELEREVAAEWKEIVEHGAKQLAAIGIHVSVAKTETVWSSAITCAWSWMAEGDDYAKSSREAAELSAATRLFRPFGQSAEKGMKCPVCGERNALPDGKRDNVVNTWAAAEDLAEQRGLGAFVRTRQTRLCIVCAAKRFYPLYARAGRQDRRAFFESFQSFQPDDRRPYFALVTMDGDGLGEALRGIGMSGPDLESFHENVSTKLNGFAEGLRTPRSAALNLASLGIGKDDLRGSPPQLIYAGGDDVLFVADPRDALRLSKAIRDLYTGQFKGMGTFPLTISAAIVFAHTKIPAGTLLRDAQRLLDEKAKEESGRDSIAISLQKRSGVPVDVTVKWSDEHGWVERLEALADSLRQGELASRQSYSFADDERVLSGVFSNEDEWRGWLEWRLSKGEMSAEHSGELAPRLARFLFHGKTDALRIARFLGIETERANETVTPEASA